MVPNKKAGRKHTQSQPSPDQRTLDEIMHGAMPLMPSSNVSPGDVVPHAMKHLLMSRHGSSLLAWPQNQDTGDSEIVERAWMQSLVRPPMPRQAGSGVSSDGGPGPAYHQIQRLWSVLGCKAWYYFERTRQGAPANMIASLTFTCEVSTPQDSESTGPSWCKHRSPAAFCGKEPRQDVMASAGASAGCAPEPAHESDVRSTMR